jgi:septal ring factor EnvC (AmiA/AmiB activator)
MKNIIIAILLAAAVALGAFCVHQQKLIVQTETQLAQTETQLVGVQSQLQDLSGADKRIEQAQKKSEILQETLVKTSAFADEKSKQAEQLQQKIAAARTNSPMSGMAALFKDPKMREMIKTQQQAFMGPMIDKQYKDLFQQLNLTPDQAAGFRETLI